MLLVKSVPAYARARVSKSIALIPVLYYNTNIATARHCNDIHDHMLLVNSVPALLPGFM